MYIKINKTIKIINKIKSKKNVPTFLNEKKVREYSYCKNPPMPTRDDSLLQTVQRKIHSQSIKEKS